jgi:very-short-patch-repair endonuclease
MIIEFDGVQHTMPIKRWGGEESFKITVEKDFIKDNYCLNNGIRMLRIPYTDIVNIENILDKNLVDKSI